MLGQKVAPAALNESTPRAHRTDGCRGHRRRGPEHQSVLVRRDRDLAAKRIRLQNDKTAELWVAHPERFVAFATTAMQHPELAAQQLEDGVKKLAAGYVGRRQVEGQELSDPKFHPIWAKGQEMGLLVFMHPIAHATTENSSSAATAHLTMRSAIRSRPRSRCRT